MSNDTKKIDRAMRSCIRECFGSTSVLAKIAEYLDSLRQDPDWRPSEVLLVEDGVRRILKGTSAEVTLELALEARARKSA